MEMGAYEAVRDYYYHGHNSRNGYYYHSLHSMSTIDHSSISLLYDTYVNYFGGDNDYVETLIINAIERSGPFEDATEDQRAAIVTHTIKQMLMYMFPLTQLNNAVEKCKNEQSDAANSWDRGAGSLIGSIEGNHEGGNHQGQLYYSLIKSSCEIFGTCNMTNHDLVDLLQEGQERVEAGECEVVQNVTEKIRVLLDITNIQRTLHYAAKLEDVPFSNYLAGAFISASTVIPMIKHSDHASGLVIEDDFKFKRTLNLGEMDTNEVFEAFESALKNMKDIDCADIGAIEKYGDVCPEAPIMPGEDVAENTYVNPSETISLSSGLYVTTSNVDEL